MDSVEDVYKFHCQQNQTVPTKLKFCISEIFIRSFKIRWLFGLKAMINHIFAVYQRIVDIYYQDSSIIVLYIRKGSSL